MKTIKPILACIFLFFPLSFTNAQQNIYPPVGNVGIGTVHPSEQLHITGNIRIDGLAAPGLAIRPVYVDETGKLIVARERIPGGGGGSGIGGSSCTPLFNDFGFYAPLKQAYLCDMDYKIGIGTTDPEEKLHVKGYGRFESAASYADFFTIGHDGANSILEANGAGGLLINYYKNKPVVVAGTTFTTWNTTFLSVNGGNVGIGTQIPETKLAVNGLYSQWGTGLDGSLYQRFQLYADVANGLLFDAPKNASGTKLDINFQWRGDSQPLVVFKGNTQNVGIGTNNPVSKLHVNGWIAVGDLSANGYTGVLQSNYASGIQFKSVNNDFLAITTYDDGADNSQLLFYTGDNSGDGVIFRNVDGSNGSTDYLKICRGGMWMEGGIAAQKIKVQIAKPWCDYVFEPDYELMPLTELKKYLEQNKHLPEIPDANEVKQNGIDLGEMNTLLLKKIEELTLHVIKLDEQNKKLEEQLNLLKK